MKKIYLPKSALSNLYQTIEESNEIQAKLEKIGDSPKIICLYGNHGYGKDVWAKIIHTGLPNSKIFSFAGAVREIFNEAGFSDTVIDAMKRSDVIKFLPGTEFAGFDCSELSMRESLIKVAEGIKKRKGEDYWANMVYHKMNEAFQDGVDILIVTDMRFDIEHQRVVEFSKTFGLQIERFNIPTNLPKIEIL